MTGQSRATPSCFAEHRFDAIHIVFHENEFFFRVREAFEEFVEGVGQPAQVVSEEIVKLLLSVIDGGQHGNILGGEAFLKPFVLGVKRSVDGVYWVGAPMG